MSNKQEVQFNNINASSLFHFTKKIETLESILSNGLRFSYAFEAISPQITANINYSSNPKVVEELLKKTGVAIPMISFCDIPITRASTHMERYGKYMIGFNKRHLTEWYKNTINPVLYVHSGNLNDAMVDLSKVYAEAVNTQIGEIVLLSKQGMTENSPEIRNLTMELGLRKFFILFLYGLTKPVYQALAEQFFHSHSVQKYSTTSSREPQKKINSQQTRTSSKTLPFSTRSSESTSATFRIILQQQSFRIHRA